METNYERNCPTCGCVIKYKNRYNLKNAEDKKNNCKSCGIKKIMTNDYLKKMSDRVRGDKNPMYGKNGDKNPFYGKKHTEETINKLKNRDTSPYKTQEFRDKIASLNQGDKNPMYGKSFYDMWVKKYGEEIAIEKLKLFKQKISKSNSGENNPMYGKPAPKKSGNGWSGWYNGWFFRSLIELTYMIKIIERYGLSWESGESDKFKIEYIDVNNKKKNYFPDFIINNKYVVEIKPKSLVNTDKVFRKTKYAKKFCEKNNMIYKITSPPIMETKELVMLYTEGKIKFVDKYEKKFQKYYLKV
jgi:hypothetical protein